MKNKKDRREFRRWCQYLVMFEHSIDQQRRLLLHPLDDGVSDAIVRLGARLSGCDAVFIIHVLFGRSERRGTDRRTAVSIEVV